MRTKQSNHTPYTTTTQELELVNKIVAESAGWYRNGGIAYEFNSYGADGTFFDWVGGA